MNIYPGVRCESLRARAGEMTHPIFAFPFHLTLRLRFRVLHLPGIKSPNFTLSIHSGISNIESYSHIRRTKGCPHWVMWKMLAAFPFRKETIAHYFSVARLFYGLGKEQEIMNLNLNQVGQVKCWEIFVGRRVGEI